MICICLDISIAQEFQTHPGADVIDIFVKAGYEVVAYPTQAYRDAYKKIKKYDESIKELLIKNEISEGTFYKRIKYGWTIMRACTEPINSRKAIINRMAQIKKGGVYKNG